MRMRMAIAAAAALFGPIVAALSAILVSSLGLDAPVGLLAVLVFATLAWAIAVIARRSIKLGAGAAVPTLGLVAFLTTYCGAPLPAPPALRGALPAASPPPGMTIAHLPTGITHRSAAFAYRGGSFSDRRDFTMSAVLVTHPRGDLLIDAGFGGDIDAQVAAMPLAFRIATHYERSASAAQQLDAAGYDGSRLAGILLTHAHWDHVSGVGDFPDVPVLVSAEERRFIDDGGWVVSAAASVPSSRYRTYAFESGEYLGFPRSHNVYGDGSIVAVPAPGHTRGSVIVFVALPGGRRYAFVGDLVWQREGIAQREERPWLNRMLADDAPSVLRASLSRMAAIATRFPEIALVPAHDARAFAGIPRLSSR
jgi:glyoxylase-like metal-dependent hydrolase (beta-lactamase superfamily II)